MPDSGHAMYSEGALVGRRRQVLLQNREEVLRAHASPSHAKSSLSIERRWCVFAIGRYSCIPSDQQRTHGYKLPAGSNQVRHHRHAINQSLNVHSQRSASCEVLKTCLSTPVRPREPGRHLLQAAVRRHLRKVYTPATKYCACRC